MVHLSASQSRQSIGLLVVALFFAVSFLAGCGGSSETSSVPQDELSQFLEDNPELANDMGDEDPSIFEDE